MNKKISLFHTLMCGTQNHASDIIGDWYLSLRYINFVLIISLSLKKKDNPSMPFTFPNPISRNFQFY